LIRHRALGNDRLSEVGRDYTLDLYINRNAGTPNVTDSMMATAVEAVLGAVFEDGGDGALARVMTQLRIGNPFENLVMFKSSPSHLCILQILYDLLTLTLIGLLREGSPCGRFARLPNTPAHLGP
jgi:hypothetical protein